MVGLEPLTLEQKKSEAKSLNHSAKPITFKVKHLAENLYSWQGRMKLTKKA